MQQTFTEQLFNALSWTFIHSLWQGLVLTILAGIIVSATRKSLPSFRYTLLAALLFCFIGTTLITFAWQWQINAHTTTSRISDTNLLMTPEIPAMHGWWNNFSQFMNQYAGWIVPAWAIIVLLKFLRLFFDFLYVHRLRTSYICRPDEAWITRLQQLSHEIGIRKRVQLLESQLVNFPVVTGHFKPIILVPLGILTKLSPDEVEAVLLHELAHIRRHDYLVNLVQRVTGIIFFFNPGVLWLSSLIRAERENCCDHIAITHTKNKLQFVEALISVKQHSLSSQRLAMNFLGPKNLLLHRINRIVYSRNKSLNVAERLFFACSFLFAILFFSSKKVVPATERSLTAVKQIPTLANFPKFVVLLKQQQSDVKTEPERTSTIRNKLKVSQRSKEANSSINKTEKKLKQPVSKHTASVESIIARNEPGTLYTDRELAMLTYSHYDKERMAAERDRIQAERDRAQAELDRIQADADRKQADLDRIQADKDRRQAELDRKQAEKDRAQADRDMAEAKRDRLVAIPRTENRINK